MVEGKVVMVSWEIEGTINMDEKRNRGHTNQIDLWTVNKIEAESSSHVKAGDWNCIS